MKTISKEGYLVKEPGPTQRIVDAWHSRDKVWTMCRRFIDAQYVTTVAEENECMNCKRNQKMQTAPWPKGWAKGKKL